MNLDDESLEGTGRGQGGGRSSLSPLWVISLFLSFTETVLGFAVMKTQGGVQMALTAFVIVFPSVICLLFFVILWWRPYVFYPPKEFRSEREMESYVEAMRSAGPPVKSISSIVKETVAALLSSAEVEAKARAVVTQPSEAGRQEKLEELLDLVNEGAESAARQVLVVVDSRPLLGDRGAAWEEPYDPDMPAYQFLDNIWFKLYPHVKAYTYGSSWVLRNKKTVFRDMGRPWALSRGEREDMRPISSVGIEPGSVLEVTRTEPRFNVHAMLGQRLNVREGV